MGSEGVRGDAAQAMEFDLYYIENWSVLFDLYILIKTPLALLKSENAY